MFNLTDTTTAFALIDNAILALEILALAWIFIAAADVVRVNFPSRSQHKPLPNYKLEIANIFDAEPEPTTPTQPTTPSEPVAPTQPVTPSYRHNPLVQAIPAFSGLARRIEVVEEILEEAIEEVAHEIIDYAKLTVAELRKACTEQGIKWRFKDRKPLTKTEMVSILGGSATA